ncbi:MAG: DUF3052 domain-containing protein [Pseudomonadota bacterium]
MSEKMIAEKMYLKTAKSLAILNGEVHPSMVAQLPSELLVGDEQQAEVVLMFALNQKELEKWFPLALARLGEKGSLWVAFLKQSAAKATDISRESISSYARDQGVTGVATISVDLDWSALRLKRL